MRRTSKTLYKCLVVGVLRSGRRISLPGLTRSSGAQLHVNHKDSYGNPLSVACCDSIDTLRLDCISNIQ